METIRFALVEDEERWREKVKNEVSLYFDKQSKVTCFESGEDFLKKMEQYDVVLMDIELPDKNGFEVSEEYKKKYPNCILVILTTHTELSRKGYFVDAFRYIDKITLHEELFEAFGKIEKMFADKETIKFYRVSIGNIELPIEDIVYIETEKRNILVHTDKGQYCCKDNIRTVEESLKGKGFCSPHRSYLVNMRYMLSVNKKEVTLKNGERILLSSRKYNQIKKDFFYWKFEYGNG